MNSREVVLIGGSGRGSLRLERDKDEIRMLQKRAVESKKQIMETPCLSHWGMEQDESSVGHVGWRCLHSEQGSEPALMSRASQWGRWGRISWKDKSDFCAPPRLPPFPKTKPSRRQRKDVGKRRGNRIKSQGEGMKFLRNESVFASEHISTGCPVRSGVAETVGLYRKGGSCRRVYSPAGNHNNVGRGWYK